VLGEGLC